MPSHQPKRVQHDGGVSEQKVEELLQQVGADLEHFSVLLPLSKSIHFLRERVYLWELYVGVLFSQLFQEFDYLAEVQFG